MKRVLLAAIIIVSVTSLAAIGTYAGFVDTETSEDNFIQADTLDLILENPQDIGESWGHSVLRTWHYENMVPPGLMQPGDVLTSHVDLTAFSSSQADHVDIQCVNVDSEPDVDTPPENEAEAAILGHPVPFDPGYGIYDKSNVMIIIGMTYHTRPIIWGEYNSYDTGLFTDTDGDGRISLGEFEAQGLQGLVPVPNSGEITFSMTVKFAEDAGNEYQGDATMMTLIFLLMGQ